MFETPAFSTDVTQCVKCGHVVSKCSGCGHDAAGHTKNPRFVLTCYFIDKFGKTCPCTEKFQ